jgi:hypothetical protein
MNAELEERIRNRAYEIWELEGHPDGRDGEHWHQATRELVCKSAASANVESAAKAAGSRPAGSSKKLDSQNSQRLKPRSRSVKSPQVTFN